MLTMFSSANKKNEKNNSKMRFNAKTIQLVFHIIKI